MRRVVVGIIARVNTAGEKEYLLVSVKKDFGKFTGHFYPPGGHVEEGESDSVALVRELQEELGLSVKPERKFAETDGDVPDQRTSWWFCSIVGGVLSPQQGEIAVAGYFTRTQMEQLPLWPMTKEVFTKYIFSNHNA